MKISASLYSTNSQDLPSLVHELDELHLDYFHIDCFDGAEEKTKRDILAIKEISDTPIDLHAISSDAVKFYKLADKLGVSQLTLQLENLNATFEVPKKRNYLLGLAVVNDTDLSVLEKYQSQIDYILLMTTKPGMSGGKFQKESFNRIRKCKSLYPNLPIYVDGGINAEISFILRLLGVSLAVSGSFLVNNPNIAAALADLRFHQKGSDYLLGDFMKEREGLPIVEYCKTTFHEVLETMESYNMGFVLFEEDGKLKGITSNADLRKGLLKNVSNLNNINLDDVLNLTPITIESKATIYEMISLIKKHNFPILFLPVVDKGSLKGVITFNELIKGEG